jgi:hypothetical protein
MRMSVRRGQGAKRRAEERAWEKLKGIEALYWANGGPHGWPEQDRKHKRARDNFRRALRWEAERERRRRYGRVPAQARAAVLAEWEASPLESVLRVCPFCCQLMLNRDDCCA